jgi:phage tail-like protein
LDVNGTRFHLLKGKADFDRCDQQRGADGEAHFTWDRRHGALGLTPQLALSVLSDARPLGAGMRRGAAGDRFGNRYWISEDEERVYWQPSGGKVPAVYFDPLPAPELLTEGDFTPLSPAAAEPTRLAGLAVTEHHYLVVGSRGRCGLFVIDLHAGGPATLLSFVDDLQFTPFDIAAAPGGGVWVLDREHRRYFGLDRNFRVVACPGQTHTETESLPLFGPVDGQGSGPVLRTRILVRGFDVTASHPVSIEALQHDEVLVLDSPPADTRVSTIERYRLGVKLDQLRLEVDADVRTQNGEEKSLSVVGHDIAFLPAESTLYVVEASGRQVMAFPLQLDDGAMRFGDPSVRTRFLPLVSYGGRALDRTEDQIYYDVTVGGDLDRRTRWVPLAEVERQRFERQAVLDTPVFDGHELGCVWHRFFLDACLPPEASVVVATRADDDRDVLETLAFEREPDLYRRARGAELPFVDVFETGNGQVSDERATWELLFQNVRGRYLQIRLELTSNGRSTPYLYALRAYYPRFSYRARYLPAVYSEDPESAGFVERFLANPEGIFTELEGKIAAAAHLFDAATAPADALDWLAGWLGLAFDPIWQSLHQRWARARGERSAVDRRRLVVRFGMRLYAARGTKEGMLLALQLLLDPCLEQTLARLERATIAPDPVLSDHLDRLDLPVPSPGMTTMELEELLRAYLTSPRRSSRIRIVERFETAAGRAVAAGDPTPDGEATATAEALAHRFTVLVPEDLTSDEAAMVRRLIELEKPAHTAFDVRRYWEGFRVGEVRVGIDTLLGDEQRFVPMVLGRQYLGEGYLTPDAPGDVTERLVADRDRLGGLPAL